MILTLFAFAIMVGVLIFVHELGHFVAAKSLGIQVHRFSLGFGKPILMFRRGETEYCISVLPLGGYVKMAGLEEEGMMGEIEGRKPAQPVDPARAFDRHRPGRIHRPGSGQERQHLQPVDARPQ
jgi:regulator of sigma E protease